MSTPLPGQIRCPTCHRSTPPAAFCTQCGTAIPESARARPRGLDREELQDRIRSHRPGDAAFRRGSQVGGGAESGPPAYRPFQAEPEDELVLSAAAAADVAAAHVDNTPPDFDAPPPLPPVVAPLGEPPHVVPPLVVAPPVEPPTADPVRAQPAPIRTPFPPVVPGEPLTPEPTPLPSQTAPVAPPAPPIEQVFPPQRQWSAPDDPYAAADAGGPDNRYRDPGDEWDRRGPGMSPLAIGGFVLLGVLAIGVGAFMAGLFSGGAAVASPSPTPLASTLPSSSLQASLGPSSNPSAPASLGPTATPVPVPDGFTARTEPCAEQPASQDGCGSSGATVTGGSIWIWVGWRKGSDADTLGVHIEDATGTTVGTGSLALSSIGASGCGASCNGWARFKFGGLTPGDYTIHVDRNGTQVATGSFTVNA